MGDDEEGRGTPGGKLPINTNGGGLSYTHSGMYGIFPIIEAVRQQRGECGPRQVPNAKLSLVNGTGGMLSAAGTLVLSHQRQRRGRNITLVVALVVSLLLTPAAVVAQTADKVARVGVLSPVNPRTAPQFVAFEERLRDLGWIDGRTVTIDFRQPKSTDGLPAAAADLVRSGVRVILATGPEPPLKAVRQATATVPIVMVAINYDPVERGYIASVARPGGNITGVYWPVMELGAKQLEFLREALPKATQLAVLWDSQFSQDQLPSIEAAAKLLNVRLHRIEVSPPYDLEAAFGRIKVSGATGVLLAGSPVFFRERARISQLALTHRLPMASSGGYESGLLGYGPSLEGLFRRAAEYVDRVLRGASPADLPVERPTTVELTINLKTARALGLTLPQSLLQRATRVVQ